VSTLNEEPPTRVMSHVEEVPESKV
jgi:hypothetical protein